MNRALFMNYLWYEEISPEQLADAISLSEEQLFDKLVGYMEFAPGEIRQIAALLGLSKDEVNHIFFDGGDKG